VTRVVVALSAFAGFAVAAVLWMLLQPSFGAPALLRKNYREIDVPVAGGIVIAASVVFAEAARAAYNVATGDDGGVGDPERAAVLVAAVGFCLLGVFDDLAGGADAKGFRGHLGALARGRLTTGGLKLFGGAAVAVIAVAAGREVSLVRLIADAALVALAANLGNLFDRAPGRVTKYALVTFGALLAATGAPALLAASAVVIGAGAGTLMPDLRERVMLGDAGANVLGAVLGLAVVLSTSPLTRTVVLIVVFVLNLASEVVSFSRVIDRVPPLRLFDRLGRIPATTSQAGE
jgi:UDP-N-acetylmuramyl pentapeptide phosphotransferase/UDP-N-acetylglucosamine-1-phosphate transferase